MALNEYQQWQKQENARSRKHGDQGEAPAVTVNKAANFCIRAAKQGAVLTCGMAFTKKGQFALTLAMVAGNKVLQSPSLDACALGMGAVTAAHFIIDATRHRSKAGSVPYDEQAINAWKDDPNATSGHWGEL